MRRSFVPLVQLGLLGRIGLLGEAGQKRPLVEKKSGADEN